MTQLGLGSYAVAWAAGVPGYPRPTMPLDAVGLLRRAASLGVHLVQIADNIPLHALSEDALEGLSSEAKRLGVSIEVGTRGIQPEHLFRYLALARWLRSPILRVVVDTRDHHPSPEEVVDLLRSVLPAFEAAGVAIAIENHDRFRTETLAGIIGRIGRPSVGICLDTVNSFGSLEGPQVVVEALGPHVLNLHVKDFRIRRADHNMGFAIEGTPAGDGMLDVPWLLERLHGFGRSFNAILELWPAPEAEMEATIAKEAAWVERSVAYLRRVIG